MADKFKTCTAAGVHTLVLIAACMLVVFAMFRWPKLQRIQIIHKDDTQRTVNQTSICEPMPSVKMLKALSREQLADIYHGYVNNVQVGCTRVVREGNVGDGGWNVCLDGPFNLQKPCLVYSFGINYDWSFDDAIAQKYGCEVHSYDPSMLKLKDHDRKPNLHFHRTGLGNKDEINNLKWRMRTFTSILKENKHEKSTIDLLKIDIEFAEWLSFPEMIKSGSLKHVKQFCFEIHIKLNEHPEPSLEMYLKGLAQFRELHQYGYRTFKTHRNMDAKYKSVFGIQRTGCHEIYMIRNHTNSS